MMMGTSGRSERFLAPAAVFEQQRSVAQARLAQAADNCLQNGTGYSPKTASYFNLILNVILLGFLAVPHD